MKKIEEWKERNLKNYLENNYLNDDDISHIFDWLKSDDAKKYQRQLYKLSVPDAVRLSKKWTEKLIKKASDEESENDVKVVYEFEDKFTIKELLTKQAYSREGKLMGHCVGGYTVGEQTIVSLRDIENKPHCTIEIKNGEIQQIQGKENKGVVKKYQKYVKEYIEKKELKANKAMLLKIGILVDEEEKEHNLYNLPKEPLVFKSNLDLSGLELEEIPNIICYGYLYLSNNKITEIPEGFIQKGTVYLENNLIKEIPKEFKQNGHLYLHNNKIKEIPRDFKQNGSLCLNNNLIKEISEGFIHNGYLNLSHNLIEEIPKDFKHYGTLNLSNNKIKEIPKGFIQNGRLYLNNNKITEIPRDFKQCGFLDLSNNKIKEIPKDFKQCGWLYLNNNLIEEIPKDFKQCGFLDLSNNKIKEIPKNFKQNGTLDLSNNKIKEIQKGFIQKGPLYLNNNEWNKN